MRTHNTTVIQVSAFLLAIVLVCSGCSHGFGKMKPEVGHWHTTVYLDDVDDSLTEEDRLMMLLVAGDVMFEIDAEFFENGSFTYMMNTDQLEEALTESMSAILGMFMDFDMSAFIKHIAGTVLEESLGDNKLDFAGTYSVSKDDRITATDDEICLYFVLQGGSLIQVEADGTEVLEFSKVS